MTKNNEFNVVPAIDIMEGRCVRLCKGVFKDKTTYRQSPLSAAMEFEDAGFKRVHIVDLDGAKDGSRVNFKLIAKISQKTKMKVDVGGGIRKIDDVKGYLDSGVDMVTISTMAVNNRKELVKCMDDFGGNRFILGADVRGEKVTCWGWKETSGFDIYEFIQEYQSIGIKRILCTDVARDGMFFGPSMDLYQKIMNRFKGVFLIASGGVRGRKDLVGLQKLGVSEVIIGKAIYENKIDLNQLVNLDAFRGDEDAG